LKDVLIWGAQLEQSSTVGEYVKTTSTINSAPRFDHDPTTGESLGLLVEESRTNLLYPSQFTSFETTAAQNIWYESVAELDATVNAGLAPDGTTTAALLATNTNTTFRAVFNRTGATTQATYSYSVYLKAASTSTSARLFIAGEAALTNNCYADYTLSGSGSASAATVAGTATAPTAPTIQAVGNGWYRCTLYAALTSPANITCLIYPGTATAQTTASQTLVWGAQLEAGSFPTSYIPTEGSAVTRAADVADISGSNFSSWYNQTASTVLAEINKPFTGVFSAFGSIFNANDGTSANRIGFVHRLGGQANIYSFSNTAGSNSLNFNVFNTNAAGAYKYALAITANSARSAGDGNLLGAADDTSVSVPTVLNQAVIQAVDSIHIRRLTYWPTRLSNETLQGITQQ
jgi:hypothetical protein